MDTKIFTWQEETTSRELRAFDKNGYRGYLIFIKLVDGWEWWWKEIRNQETSISEMEEIIAKVKTMATPASKRGRKKRL